MKKENIRRQVTKIGGLWKEVVTVYDKSGGLIHKVINPLMLDFRPRDLMQVIVGSTILAVPVMFTEEVWTLGAEMSLETAISINLVSLLFISAFVYYNFYRDTLRGHWLDFIKRTLSIYIVSFGIAAVLLTLIGKADWQGDYIVAIKRAILVALPASMSAAVADMVK